jgi:hypothetical protein
MATPISTINLISTICIISKAKEKKNFQTYVERLREMKQ